MKKIIIIIISIICLLSVSSCACESLKRDIKSISSDFSGGLNRTLVLMDYEGDTLKTWTGRFDIRDSGADNQVFFDLNGKRVWIQGGIVVSEEY